MVKIFHEVDFILKHVQSRVFIHQVNNEARAAVIARLAVWVTFLFTTTVTISRLTLT